MADVVCLQEATEVYATHLQNLGYTAFFLPRCIKSRDGIDFVDGILMASLHPITFTQHYYYNPHERIEHEVFDEHAQRNTTPRAILKGTITYKNTEYILCTTHFTWTKEGNKPCKAQQDDMAVFTELVQALGAHVMCGDFNIPRHHNFLYGPLSKLYTDTVPESYQSSLDPAIHRCGLDPSKQNLFTDYMVDYVFTQPPYSAINVHLEFGLSDHAAILADVHKT
jgi:endonuclease/exonuclease/phosphatase family metal-dependent hydrolase